MKNEFNSFLKVLSVILLAKQERDYKKVKSKIVGWSLDTHTFLSNLDYKGLKGLNFDKYANSFGNIIQSIHDGDKFSSFSDHVEYLADWIEANRKRGMWTRIVDLSTEQTNFLDYLRKVLLIKGSESSERYIEQKINILREPELTKCFAGDLNDEYVHKKELPPSLDGKTDSKILAIISNISKMLPGNKEVPPFCDPQKIAKEQDPVKFAIWLAGRDYLQNKAKKMAANIIRTYGNSDTTNVPVLPIKDLTLHLKNSNIVWPLVNPNLTKGELIDDSLYVYTKEGLSLDRSIPYTAKIEYNRNYTPDYNDKFSTGIGGMYYLKLKTTSSLGYSNVSPSGRANSNKDATFERVLEATKKLDSYRTKWISKLKSRNPEIRMAATIIEIVYQTAIRIGSKIGTAKGSDGKEQETYGLTVLKKKNAKSLTGRIKLHYVGKAAQVQTQLLIKNKDVHYNIAIENLESYLENKGPNDFIFTYTDSEDGKLKRFTAAKANYYLKEIAGMPTGITIHKFRHIKANILTLPILENCPLIGNTNNTTRSVLAWLNENIKVVGEDLGHFKDGEVVGTTAIASYIDPKVIKLFFEKCKVQVPSVIEKKMREDA